MITSIHHIFYCAIVSSHITRDRIVHKFLTAAGIIVSALNVPAGVAVSIGSYIYGAIGTLSPAKMIVNQTLYEVHFSYDDMYYTHCYHEVMKSYDTGGHLIDRTVMYKQAIGG